MAEQPFIVIGASAGGVEGLIKIVAGLPRDLNASLFVTLHLSPNNTSLLPSILGRSGPLPVRHPENHESIQRGVIYVAPPDHHLLVEPDQILLTRGVKENGHRPSVDVMFRTAAKAHGARVAGVVLSGARDDGTAGLRTIRENGGVTVAQEPSDALYPSMPQNAIDHAGADYILPVEEIPALLVSLAEELSSRPMLAAQGAGRVPDIAEYVVSEEDPATMPGRASGFICPDCGGALWEMSSAGLLRFRCHVGHAWSQESLLDAELLEVEEALSTAYRALREHISLSRRVADSARRRGNFLVAKRFDERLAILERRSGVLRRLLTGGNDGVPDQGDLNTNGTGAGTGTGAGQPKP